MQYGEKSKAVETAARSGDVETQKTRPSESNGQLPDPITAGNDLKQDLVGAKSVMPSHAKYLTVTGMRWWEGWQNAAQFAPATL